MISVAPRILYIQYTNPAAYPPLEHSSRILATMGWKVLFLGTGALGADSLRFSPHPNITVKQLSFCPAGFRQKLHYVRYCLWVIGWVTMWRPRWIYASDPLSCPIGWLLSLIPGFRIVYHEHDSPSAVVGLNGWTRRRLAHRARCVVLPNAMRAERFKTEIGAPVPVLSVWNCPARDEVSGPRAPTDPSDIWLLYHGSLSPDRLPLSVLEVCAKCSDSLKLRVIGYETVGCGGYLDALRLAACALNISNRVEIIGTVPTRVELLQYCKKSDIGLALMPMATHDPNMLNMAGASNKAFDYMACGLPFLVSDLPEWKTLYVDPGYAVACRPDEPLSIERALRALLDAPDEMRAIGERGRQRICCEWNYEREFAKVLRVITKNLAIPVDVISNRTAAVM